MDEVILHPAVQISSGKSVSPLKEFSILILGLLQIEWVKMSSEIFRTLVLQGI